MCTTTLELLYYIRLSRIVLILQIHSKLAKKCVKLKEKTYFMKFVKIDFSFLLNITIVTSSDQSCLYYCTKYSNSAYKCHQLQYWLSHSKARMKNA